MVLVVTFKTKDKIKKVCFEDGWFGRSKTTADEKSKMWINMKRIKEIDKKLKITKNKINVSSKQKGFQKNKNIISFLRSPI